MAKGTEPDNGARNHIANGTIIKGDVIAEGNIRIDGSLEGTLSSKAKVVVGSTGKIIGEVKCQNASVEGILEGKLFVDDMLSIKATGKVKGDLVWGKLEVQPGAAIEGTMNMHGKVKNIASGNAQKQEKSA